MWSYDRGFQPPAPILEVLVRHPWAPDRSRSVPVKLDTGADLSAIPEVVVDELNLLAVRTVLAEAYDGTRSRLRAYFITLEAAQARFRRLEVILIPEEYALLGRDVLNHFYAHLSGPDLTFDLRLTP
jgi:predicted aspartyl protease